MFGSIYHRNKHTSLLIPFLAIIRINQMRTILLAIFLLTFNTTFACKCKTYPVVTGKSQNQLKLEDSFENSTIIFYGIYIGEGKFETIKLYRGKKLLKNHCIFSTAYVMIFFCSLLLSKKHN